MAPGKGGRQGSVGTLRHPPMARLGVMSSGWKAREPSAMGFRPRGLCNPFQAWMDLGTNP